MCYTLISNRAQEMAAFSFVRFHERIPMHVWDKCVLDVRTYCILIYKRTMILLFTSDFDKTLVIGVSRHNVVWTEQS
jgi:hypothetical protein